MKKDFTIGEVFQSPKFKWMYKLERIENGVAILTDIMKPNIRVKFTLNALAERIKKGSFVRVPLN
jgi:hypothetical protein